MRSKRFVVISLALLLFVGGGLWWAFADAGPDPEVKKLKETMKTAFDARDSMTPAQREQIHQQIDTLTEEQRHEVFSGMRERFEEHMEQRYNEYFDAPPQQRTIVMDKHIREMEQRRREREQQRLARGKNGARDGRGGPGGGPRGARGPRGSRTPEQRMERKKSRLDHSDPTKRAKGAEYRSAMNKRREELGLPPTRGRGRGRH